MDTRIQTSFIPKKPIDRSLSAKASGGIFYLLATTVFVVALILSAGIFGYQKYLEGRIAKMEVDLSQARQSLEPELVDELTRADRRFIAADQIIKNHTTISEFLNMLESLTLQNVSFSSFTYKHAPGGIKFELLGQARSYATVAYQAKIFAEEARFVSPQFSELDLNEEGNVLFAVRSGLDIKAVSYTGMLNKAVNGVPVTQIEEIGAQANVTQGGLAASASSTLPLASSTTP